ncbi:zinc-binding dehydrogenase [Streptomyces sp. CHA15]|nr:zinc-binding dehydrogenase [Streptomyces sp. CHA15]
MRPQLLQDTARQVIGYLAEGKLDIKIGKLFSLEEAASAHAWVESRQSTGKVLLKVRP